jgi:uncharacterized protein
MQNHKLKTLRKILQDMESVLLAYSGGVDSTFLLKAVKLSGIRALAVTGSAEILSDGELLHAQKRAEEIVMPHRIIPTDVLSREDFLDNTPERCFFCKDTLLGKLSSIALSEGFRYIIDGGNKDDLEDYRPGRKALAKYNVRSPLIEAGFSKEEVRECSRYLGLSTWDLPSSPCLATRIPFGRRITKETLKRIEKAEDFLKSIGLRVIRVRDHGDIARIEAGEEEIAFLLHPEKRKNISETLRSIGYTFISLDLDGYRSGSMNRIKDERNSCRKHNT